MPFQVEILADSMSVYGDRLTTFCIQCPRMILAELNTHRMLSRNAASSRAIPVEKAIRAVYDDPFIPVFGANQPGMTAGELLAKEQADEAARLWICAREDAARRARQLADLDVHKSWANRLMEPFRWTTNIVTATDWENFFALRTDENAQAEFRKIALMMQTALEENTPKHLHEHEWHVPLTDDMFHWGKTRNADEDRAFWDHWRKISAGRCARVSYLTHDGKRDPAKDIELADSLMANGHMSPFEHQATPFTERDRDLMYRVRDLLYDELMTELRITVEQSDRIMRGACYDQNLRGWHSYRSFLPNQDNYQKTLRAAQPYVGDDDHAPPNVDRGGRRMQT